MRIIILSSCLNPAIPARFGNPQLNQLKISFTQDACCEKAWPFEGGYMPFHATGKGPPGRTSICQSRRFVSEAVKQKVTVLNNFANPH
jgi:hypothetical protein